MVNIGCPPRHNNYNINFYVSIPSGELAGHTKGADVSHHQHKRGDHHLFSCCADTKLEVTVVFCTGMRYFTL